MHGRTQKDKYGVQSLGNLKWHVTCTHEQDVSTLVMCLCRMSRSVDKAEHEDSDVDVWADSPPRNNPLLLVDVTGASTPGRMYRPRPIQGGYVSPLSTRLPLKPVVDPYSSPVWRYLPESETYELVRPSDYDQRRNTPPAGMSSDMLRWWASTPAGRGSLMVAPHFKIIMHGSTHTVHAFFADETSFGEMALVYLGKRDGSRTRQAIEKLLQANPSVWQRDRFSAKCKCMFGVAEWIEE